MPVTRRRRRAAPRKTPGRAGASSRPRRPPTPRGFVGRDASPVLERYPPRPGAAPPPPPVVPPSPARIAPPPPSTSPASTPTAGPAPPGLLTLDRPFDADEFAQLLGSTAIRVEVPKDALAEVLRRITDFMGFGIYVYAVSVRPGPDEMLRRFVVELQRVDFSVEQGRWVPFQEKGTVDSPFGPTGAP